MSGDSTGGCEREEVRGARVEVVLERDDDGHPTETVVREVPRDLVTKVQHRKKSKRNPVWNWNGTIRIDLSESGLRGDRVGIIDIKYIEGGVFLPPEDDGNDRPQDTGVDRSGGDE